MMKSENNLTVEYALNEPLFQQAQVVAGHKGLHRRIRWVHILETTHFETLIHGEEMILSTGIGLQLDGLNKAHFLEKLISHGASCLCLELGSYLDSVPEEMIEFANRFDFPLIVFRETVRFIDITQHLHSLIINRHHKMLEDLEAVSRELHRLTLSSQGTMHILKILHESTKSQVLFFPDQGTSSFIPAMDPKRQTELEKVIQSQIAESKEMHKVDVSFHWKYKNHTFLTQPVGVTGQIWAYLVLMITSREPEEFDFLVLDRAAISVSQDLLRKRYIEERKLHTENLWVDDLIHNRLKNEDEIKNLIQLRIKNQKAVKYQVCLIEIITTHNAEFIDSEMEFESIRLHIALMMRSVFEKYLFRPFMMTKNNQLVVVNIDLNPEKSSKERLKKVFQSIQAATEEEKLGKVRLRYGVGRPYTQFTNAHRSYHEAQQALEMNGLEEYETKPDYFYEDLGVFRLLMSIEDRKSIESFIDDYIGPLIEHDRTKGSDFLRTLKVYLDHDGSKQLTAQKLYIVRQTLYHRLDKIKELLGDDFISPEKRISIEMAIRAHLLLHQFK